MAKESGEWDEWNCEWIALVLYKERIVVRSGLEGVIYDHKSVCRCAEYVLYQV